MVTRLRAYWWGLTFWPLPELHYNILTSNLSPLQATPVLGRCLTPRFLPNVTRTVWRHPTTGDWTPANPRRWIFCQTSSARSWNSFPMPACTWATMRLNLSVGEWNPYLVFFSSKYLSKASTPCLKSESVTLVHVLFNSKFDGPQSDSSLTLILVF